MPDIFVGAGSNIEPRKNLRLGLEAIAERYPLLRVSDVYQSPPVGFSGEDFLNLVFMINTDAPVQTLRSDFETIHELAGRQRKSTVGPRTLDLDLLSYGYRVDPSERLPREDLLAYDFVLGPMAEIAPDWAHPITGQPPEHAWGQHPKRVGLRRLGPL